MPSLQACPQCGAQFDVSSFARGQQFRCGACGHLMVAHAEAAPAVSSGRVPGSRAPGGSAPTAAAGSAPSRTIAPAAASSVAAARSPRGPQYQPAQRSAEPARQAPPPRAPEREERPARERSRRGPGDAKKGAPMGLIIGAGALVLVVVLVVVMNSGGSDDKKSGGSSAAKGGGAGGGNAAAKPVEVPKETLAAVKADLKRNAPNKNSEYRAFIDRLKLFGKEGEDTLKELYEQYVETPGGLDDADARRMLGYVRFDHPIPDEITEKRGLGYVGAVEDMNKKRWLQDEDDIRIGNEAWKKTDEHAQRLRDDRVYRAGVEIWANMLKSDKFKDSKGVPYNFAHRWAAPHLICYSSEEKLSEFELLSIPDKKERKKKLAELQKKRERFEPLLDEKERIYKALNAELLRKFGDMFGIKDLAGEYGGRPDYKLNERSFRDGCPVVVWIFDSRDSFNKYHDEQKINMPPGVAGYFRDDTEMIYLFDEGNEGDARIFEVAKNLHEGTHQLHYFFSRQMNKWSTPPFSQSWIGEGLAEYFGAHKIKENGDIEFIGLNYSRLKEAQDVAKEMKGRGIEYPIVELNEMVSWKRYKEAMDYAGRRKLPENYGHLLFIYQQGWAFFYMCTDHLNGKYKKQLGDYFQLVLKKEEGQDVFRRAFKIRDEDDWEPLQKDFDKFMKELLVKDLSSYRYKPPSRKPAPGK